METGFVGQYSHWVNRDLVGHRIALAVPVGVLEGYLVDA